jgi:Protein of unknown function (DUF3307)
MIRDIFILLLVFQVKHFLADFPLQTPWMIGKFKGGKEWIAPLAAHAGVHAFFTLVIAAVFRPQGSWCLLFGVAALDFVVHFTMDRIKASPYLLGRFKALSAAEYIALQSKGPAEREAKLKSNTYFWVSLGIDQMVHHVTHYAIIYILLTS